MTHEMKMSELVQRLLPEVSDPTALIERGLKISEALAPLQCDTQTMIAARLYPAFQQTTLTEESIKKIIDESLYKLLAGTKRMEMIDVLSQQKSAFTVKRNLIDNLRKMLLAMVDDIRIVLIKLAERLVTLQCLRNEKAAEQKAIAEQVMTVYAPLANRLGVGQLKWQMEDWALRYLEPAQYNAISKALNKRREDREKYISAITKKLTILLQQSGIKNFSIAGRAKHIYSIYKKIGRKQTDVDKIYDTSALRVLVSSIEDCYVVLGIIHQAWQPITPEFDDYIVKPKPNGYRSIHTAVVDPDNDFIEIQIRTNDMHNEAELGIAAHWKYKEGQQTALSFESKITLLRDLMDWQKDLGHQDQARHAMYQKIFDERIYVLTPKGDVLDLSSGATPLDVAYHIHTELGHRCRGAKVNGVMVPLIQSLKTGDQVEIVTVKTGTPSRDWLNPTLGYLKTTQAQNKARHWFHQQYHQENLKAGMALWEKTYHKAGLSKDAIQKIFSHFNVESVDDLFAAIGSGDIGIQTVVNRLRGHEAKTTDNKPLAKKPVVPPQQFGNLLTQLARCCQPIPGDPIIGYITAGRGVTIHHRNCFNIHQAQQYRPQRIMAIDWNVRDTQKYPVDLIIEADDRAGLLRDVSQIIANEKIEILSLNSYADKLHNRAHIQLRIQITDLTFLDKISQKLKAVPDVVAVKRR